ncbi:thiamine biosynthesis protein ThiS [Helicobacter sp. 13S00401-1]|uniref:sulfur carrier protein ThiS n=1 Tax=Helicobacter sp. 13S00401-1 TaxID=1905758 RepID=UPI000BA5456B|nr:sulfur carrier protein ThiS [Helicobacter sp. 13S00401-1]PAF51444.1 thiamine biosynthesis protein ThiS [Helicobacter sp. 13S00401-1]
MLLTINGKELSFEENPLSISSLLKKLNIEEQVVAISLNTDIVKKDKWSITTLKEKDNLELLHFMGGGLSL